MVPAQRDLVTQMGADLADLVLCQNGGCWEDESVLNGVVGGEIAVCWEIWNKDRNKRSGLSQALSCSISLPKFSWKYLEMKFCCLAAQFIGGDFFFLNERCKGFLPFFLFFFLPSALEATAGAMQMC